MINQQKKRNTSFSQGGMPGLTTTTVMQRFFIRMEKPGDKFLAEHFSYEVAMLRFANSKLDKLIPERDRFKREGNETKQIECNTEINMSLETFVIHWRALIEFFYTKTKKWPDDMRAYDFTDKNKWEKARGNMSPCIENLNCRAGKEVAHLTSSRKYKANPEKNWPYKDMEKHLEGVIELFVKEANLQISQGE